MILLLSGSQDQYATIDNIAFGNHLLMRFNADIIYVESTVLDQATQLPFTLRETGFDSYVDTLPVRGAAEPAGLWLAALLSQPLRLRANANAQVYPFASEVNALALRWLAPRRDRRFFLFLNYMDTHEPYAPPPGYRALYRHAWPKPVVDHAAIRSTPPPARRPSARSAVS